MLRNLVRLLFAFAVFLSIAAAQQAPVPRVVDLTSADGLKLKGTFFAAASPGPGLILLHQCNRQRKVWDGLATRMAAAGINVMTLDLRGYGNSEGAPMDKLTPEQINVVFRDKMPLDVETAYKFLVAQPGVSHDLLAAGGASCGVNQSVHLAMNHPEIKALVLLSETTNASGRAFLRTHPSMPMFLATAEDDTDPGVSDLMQWLATLSTSRQTKYIRYKTGGHGVEMFGAHPELPDTIVEWLSITLETPVDAASGKPSTLLTPQTQFFEAIDHPGANAIRIYDDAHRKNPNVRLVSEEVLNRMGYDSLEEDNTKTAVEFLKLNAYVFPNSPNVYDSLGDAYLADGQKELARENAQKALDLLANDTTDSDDRRKGIRESAEQKLKQLSATTPH